MIRPPSRRPSKLVGAVVGWTLIVLAALLVLSALAVLL